MLNYLNFSPFLFFDLYNRFNNHELHTIGGLLKCLFHLFCHVFIGLFFILYLVLHSRLLLFVVSADGDLQSHLSCQIDH